MKRLLLACVITVACKDTPNQTTSTVTYVDAERPFVQPRAPRVVRTFDPAPADLPITAAHKRQGATTPATRAALWHVEAHAGRLGIDRAALDSIEVAHVHDVGRGAIVVKLRQRVAGFEVARTSLAVVMDRNLTLYGLTGALRPVRVTGGAVALGARDAIERAIVDLGGQAALVAAPDRGGYQEFRAPGLAGPARVKRVWFPVGDTLVPAWATEVGIHHGKRIDGARHVFAADTGHVLLRASLTDDAVFQYRVWADATGDKRFQDGPQPDYTPHPTGVPDGFEGVFAAPKLVSIDGFNANHDPWLPTGATSTAGNNVDAYADLDFDDGFSAGDIRPTTTAPGKFDRTFDVTLDPQASAGQQMAAVTQLFYVNNWLHDYWYDSGFNESAGNAQASNLGRGGAGGDVLLAEGQDASGTDNANMFTPADGASPRMQMFIFDAPPDGSPRRDGTIDDLVIAHEWGHYIHHRLVDCGSIQCAAMSEGWGDFDALFQSVRPTDNLDGAWGLGGYAARTFTANSAYFGIRRYPYSVDFTKSPLTFKFVESGIPLPSGPATSDIDFLQGADNCEPHDAGEIWTAMLWEGAVDLLRAHTFDDARRRYADYIVGGMIAAPVEPTYIEQRDAILAVAAASDSQDFVKLAAAYARRGFGTGAIAPDLNSFDCAGVVEDFTVTGSLHIDSAVLEEDAASCDGDGILDVGETGRVTVIVRNVGAANLTGPTIAVSSATPGVVFPSGASVTVGAVAPFATVTASIPIRLDETSQTVGAIDLVVGASDTSAAIASIVQPITAQANLDVAPNASTLDSFEEPSLVWTASPGGFARTFDPNSSNVVGVTVARNGDHTFHTPALQVATGQAFTLTFRHRHAFAQDFSTLLDGGVVEISTNGVDFADAATVASVPYTGTIGGSGNVLAGRDGFGGTNPGNPNFDTVTIDFGTQFGGQTVVLRFRAGGDDFADGSRWDIDDVTVTGAGLPFPLVTPETGSCLPGSRPIANAGADFSVPSGAASALDGSASADPDGGSLTFQWTQLAGPILTLSSNTVAQPTFTATTTVTNKSARFSLVVRDPDNRVSTPATVTVTIVGSGTVDGPPDAGVDGPPDAAPEPPVDAAPSGPDAGNPETGDGGGGCCDAGDARSSWLLAFAVMLLLSRRGR